MKKNFFITAFCLISLGIAGQNTLLKTQYNTPARTWESEALPLGNGSIGTMVFGDVPIDVIQVNEHSLWSGGTGKNPAYNGGHTLTADLAQKNLQIARNYLQDDMTEFSRTKTAYLDGSGKVVAQDYPVNGATRAYINSLKGTKADFGSYQSLGNINIGYTSVSSAAEIVNITGDCDNPNSSGERFPMLFDGSTTTKWFADTGWKSFPCFIAWEYDSPLAVSAYFLTSGNDVPGRDPKSWNLYGSTDGTNYTLIDSRPNVTFSSRNQTVKFILSQTVTYQFYKFEILATSANNPPQLSEFSFENAGVTQFPVYSNYRRELDIERAVAKVTYTQEDVNYTREYFVSHPDNVIIIRLTADQPGMLSRNIWLTTPQTKATISAENATITLTGQPADQTENGLKFAQQLRVIASSGTVTASGKKLVVENADEIFIISSVATNYQQCTDDTYNYFSDTDPLIKVQEAINKIGRRTYANVLETHVADYQSLFYRMSLHLDGAGNPNNKLTNTLLNGYKNKTNTTAENLYLEELYYQFGRYLLISSSRKNGLPANLQGIWAEGLTPPWAADYHTNINIQMNYWLAQQTNLSECHWPVIEYIKSLVPRGKYTAQRYFYRADGKPMRGWVDFHENNIWGNTGPAESDAFYFPAAAGWLCQDIWEYYQFNQDKAFLKEYYPVMLDAALFWVDNLWTDTRDNSLVSSPSYSPEHGPYSLGASCDQAIIAELFDMVIKADSILNPSKEADSPEITEIKEAKSHLAGPKIGLGGQFMEWKDETAMDISGDGGHRHVNHLFWLHPGSQIIPGRSAQEDLYAEAMKKTLNTRGDGGTGWSKAWKINFWARLRDGNHSHKLLEELLKESTLNNLFDTHPPFQIDGNFGATAGMTEMLVQSQGEVIELLPALPNTWSSGSFQGIKARGNFEISLTWNESKVFSAEIISHSGNVCTLRYKDISSLYQIWEKESGNFITPAILDENTIRFETTPGEVYKFDYKTGIKTPDVKNKTVEVYPNPAKAGEKITVKVNGNSPINYCIVNTSGLILKEGRLQTGKNELTLPAQKGVFILTDHSGKREFGSKIIIN